jgi:hypothetical protein
MDAAPGSPAHALTEQELFDRAQVKRSTARSALAELLASGAVQQTGQGKKGDPRRYWRTSGPIHSDESPPVPTQTIDGAPPAGGAPNAPASEIHSVETPHIGSDGNDGDGNGVLP